MYHSVARFIASKEYTLYVILFGQGGIIPTDQPVYLVLVKKFQDLETVLRANKFQVPESYERVDFQQHYLREGIDLVAEHLSHNINREIKILGFDIPAEIEAQIDERLNDVLANIA